MAFTPVGSPFDLASAGFTLAGVSGRATDDLVVIGTINSGAPSFGAGWTQYDYTAEFGTVLTVAFRRYNGVDTLPSVGDGVGVILRGGNGTPVYAEGVSGDEPSLLVADAAGVVMAVGDLIDLGGVTATFATSGTTYNPGVVKLYRPSPAGNQALSQFGAGINGMLAAFIPFAASPVSISGTAPTAAATATAGELRLPLPISGTAPAAAASVTPGALTTPSGPVEISGTAPTATAEVTAGSLVIPAIYEFVGATAVQDVQTSAGQFDLNVQILVGTAPEAAASVVPGALTGPPVISGTAPEASAAVTPGTITVAGPVVTGAAPEAAGSVTPGTLDVGAVPPVISGAAPEAGASVTPGSLDVPGGPITISGTEATADATVTSGTLDIPTVSPITISGAAPEANAAVEAGTIDIPGAPIALSGSAPTATASVSSGVFAGSTSAGDAARRRVVTVGRRPRTLFRRLLELLMPRLPRFTDKRAGETDIFAFDLRNELATGETLFAATLSAVVSSASTVADTDPGAILVNANPTLSGTRVRFTITAGVEGCTYAITAAVTTSTGRVLQPTALLTVTSPTA